MSEVGRRSVQSYEKWWVFSAFSHWVNFPKFLGKIAWNDKSAKCSCVSDYFYFIWWSRLVGSSARTYEKWSVLVFLAVWVLFPKFLGRLRSGLLELHKIISLSHVVTCPVVFILFYERSYQGGVFKVVKNDYFLVFLANWVLFPKILGRFRGDLC